GVTLPVPYPQDLFIPSEVSDLIMLPPKTKRPPGRPPTKRKRSAGEIPPSESEDYGGNDSSHTEDREVEDLICRDQAELNYNYAATVQYPPQPEVEFEFPQTCYCGGRPKLATSRTVNDPGRRYYTCDYVNDGDCHVHKWWDEAVMEEMRARDTHTLQLSEKVDYLTFWNDYDPQLNKFKDLQNETEQKLVRLEKIVSELAENRTRLTNGFEYFGKMTVAKYKRFFYSLPIVGERTEQQLILLAKAGLKEEIRDGLETEEFATLEALFEEAEEVKDGLKETPPSSPRNRRRTSPDHRSSKRARKAERKGDPEDEGYGYPGEEETGLKDDEEGDYWEWMQMDTDVDDDASDWTDDTLGSGQFRMDNYPDSSGTDSSTSDSD
ncbi:unnamed protein product, partial [Brassica oleracea var. botrytis]